MKHIKTVDGIEIHFEATPEYESIEDALSFASTGVDHSETIEAVNDGTFAHFIARVVAVKNGIELAEDTLGSCIYEDEDDFTTEVNGYFADMTSTVVAEAKEKIKELCEA